MRKFITIATVGVFLAATGSVALADGPELTIGASASYVFDVNDPDNDPDNDSDTYTISNTTAGIDGILGNLDDVTSSGTAPIANSANYANQAASGNESFNIDLVQVGVSGGSGDVSYSAKLNIGDLSTSDNDGVQLMTANVSYDAGSATITAGRVDTPIGYEVLEPWGNAHASRSIAWGLQPINHDGVTVSSSTSGLDIMLGVVNGESVGNDTDDEKGLIGSVGGSAANVDFGLSALLSELDDDTDITVLNLILSSELAGMDVAIEGTWREEDEDGGSSTENSSIAFYAGTDLGNTSLDARLEFADLENSLDATPDPAASPPVLGGLDGFSTEVWSLTVTAGWELADGVGFRLEYRHDDADDNIYGDGAISEDSVDTIQAQLVLTN